MATALGARNCPVCGASGREMRPIGELETTAQIQSERNSYDLVECRSCALIFISPMPSMADLLSIYIDSVQFSDGVYTDPDRVHAIL